MYNFSLRSYIYTQLIFPWTEIVTHGSALHVGMARKKKCDSCLGNLIAQPRLLVTAVYLYTTESKTTLLSLKKVHGDFFPLVGSPLQLDSHVHYNILLAKVFRIYIVSCLENKKYILKYCV